MSTNISIPEIQRYVGYPQYTLLDNGTTLEPLDAWDPPAGKIKFSLGDLHALFKDECVVFVGDSLLRRAADMLHILLEQHRLNKTAPATIDKYVYKWKVNAKSRHRQVGRPPASMNERFSIKSACAPGTIDSIWLPTLDELKNFTYAKNWTMVVAGSNTWDNLHGSLTLPGWRHSTSAALRHVHNSVPESVLVVWKTAPWGWRYKWEVVDDKENKLEKQEVNNFLVYYGNQAAREVVDDVNANNLRLVDWSKEILPYSFDDRMRKNMISEDGEHGAWHAGSKAKGLLYQMLANALVQYKMQSAAGIARGSSIYKNESNISSFELQNEYIQLWSGLCLGAMFMLVIFRRQILYSSNSLTTLEPR